jgi:hypothetical protein
MAVTISDRALRAQAPNAGDSNSFPPPLIMTSPSAAAPTNGPVEPLRSPLTPTEALERDFDEDRPDGPVCNLLECRPGFYGGSDFLYVRPHFSEAATFARGSMGPGKMNITAQEFNFNYSASIRAFAGYRFDSGTEVQFTYTNLPGGAQVNAGNPGPGHFIADPFGNIVGTAMVVDPNSALFGQPIVGGDHIRTTASVTTSIYDMDINKPIFFRSAPWVLKYSAGARVANIDQSYQSTIDDANGGFFSGGAYSVNFLGAGPRVGLLGKRYFGPNNAFSLFASTHGSLLVGQYQEQFSQTTTVPPFRAGQTTSVIRTIPVAEVEAGGSWRPYPWLNLTTGWLFQAWFDMGTSGGTFGGFYTVTQNSNIMSFEGLFARAEVTF